MAVYLLHFHQVIGNPANPRGTAQHYLGWTDDIDQRLWNHRQGKGSKLCAYAQSQGIRFTLAEVWTGNRNLERELKRRKRSADYCPICCNQNLTAQRNYRSNQND